MEDILRTDFDLYSRYKVSSDIINRLRTKDILKIADVGGNTNILSRLLPEDEVCTLNKINYGLPNQVIGDIRKVDLPNNHFDVVLSLDTLEHIREEDRIAAIKEMLRISREFAILGFPFKNASIVINEGVAARFYNALFKKDHIYLKEHAENSLPSADLISLFLNKSKKSHEIIKNTDLNIWLLLTIVGFYAENQYRFYQPYKELCRYFNEHLYELGNDPPYRKIFVISKRHKIRKIRSNHLYKKINVNKKIEIYHRILKTLEQINSANRQGFFIKILKKIQRIQC